MVLAPGAGSGPDSPLLAAGARGLAAGGHEAWSFAFPYRAAGRRVPDPPARLLDAWREVLDAARAAAGGRPVVVGGQSMGGRYASLLLAAGAPGAAGLVLLGYPLVPPGSGRPPRSDHWPRVAVPTLVVQGERDRFADPAALARELPRLGGPARLHAVRGADHGFGVRVRDGRTRRDVLDEVAGSVTGWVQTLGDGTTTGGAGT